MCVVAAEPWNTREMAPNRNNVEVAAPDVRASPTADPLGRIAIARLVSVSRSLRWLANNSWGSRHGPLGPVSLQLNHVGADDQPTGPDPDGGGFVQSVGPVEPSVHLHNGVSGLRGSLAVK